MLWPNVAFTSVQKYLDFSFDDYETVYFECDYVSKCKCICRACNEYGCLVCVCVICLNMLGMAVHGNRLFDRLIHPNSAEAKCYPLSFSMCIVIVDLTAFMMRSIHYAKPVQLLYDETVEISMEKRCKLFNFIQIEGQQCRYFT